MYHHVVQNRGRRQHKPPVEGERAFCAAASPTGLLVTDRNAAEMSACERKEIGGPFREVFPCRLYVTLFQGGPLGICQVRYGPARGLFLCLQPVGDNPVLFLRQETADILFRRAKRHPQGDFSLRRNTDCAGSAAA